MRLMVIGPPGSGKTTLCRRLAEERGLPLHHVDVLFFDREWKERPTEEFVRNHEAIELLVHGATAMHMCRSLATSQPLRYRSGARIGSKTGVSLYRVRSILARLMEVAVVSH